ncbi:probable 5,10-methylenetetrahydrofolate reductase [Natronomonas pharaonis DSM 2160]|uniref:5,10-methylenetetrahydromethanopterin reductase n=1 Tax=Natronomonas pharaonis (strain ATCC 35678 / DSM 2160 / CIP 103997 / JCM 8858 / NBRC 14720 / NCIMB 2260 / Gabara) TaxID=348780 RepID=A0A1U7EUG2_NATPD|nr:5,10-methylenetetrahydromethanopterin reductase [Natronomonas pharaonis]CAI48619.1 probable 5,10-methylenetetrahydrofolate reductase [Natronomonas pharaonis DSM 2160]
MIGIELTPEHPVSRIAELGEQAEAEGFDTVFASCHYNNRDPFVALDRIARRTDTVRLGPGVANPYETHPVTLASRVATLDEASDGRAVLGVGAGDASTLENLGFERERPLRRVLETFKVAQDLYAGERVDHDGTFRAADAGLNYADTVGEVPAYVGAQGPHMIRMAAKHADGVLLNGSHPRDFEWAADQVDAGLEDRPDERGSFDFAAYASVSVADDAEAARAAARPPVAFIAAGAAPPVLDRHDIDHAVAEQIGDHISAGAFDEAFDAVTPAMLEAFCIAGTPETVGEQIDDVLEYADSFVAGSPLGPDLDAAVRLAGSALQSRIDRA